MEGERRIGQRTWLLIGLWSNEAKGRGCVLCMGTNATPNGAPPFYLKAGMHHGPCIAVTMNDRLDYFGSVVNMAARLERLSSGEDVVISDAIRHDPEVVELLSAPDSQLVVERFEAQLKGFEKEQFHLWRMTHALRLA